jgi:nucleotide-binding universal stress UspA family protein
MTPYRRILMAADLRDVGAKVWRHAVGAAVATGAHLEVAHVRTTPGPNPDLSPAMALLRQWGVSPEDLSMKLVVQVGPDPRAVLPWRMTVQDPDLVILGTHQPKGLERAWNGSVGEYLARNAPHEALVVPDSARGLLDGETGEVRLRNVVLPFSEDDCPQRALDAAQRFVGSLTNGPVCFHLIHAGAPTFLPEIALPDNDQWEFRFDVHPTDQAVGRILEVAVREDADLIVMTTRGHDTLGDVAFGSHTDRVMREAPCPVLVVPIAQTVLGTQLQEATA